MQATPEEKALWQHRIDIWPEAISLVSLEILSFCLSTANTDDGVKDYQFSSWKKKLSFHAKKEGQPKNIQPRLFNQHQRLLNRLHLFQ